MGIRLVPAGAVPEVKLGGVVPGGGSIREGKCDTGVRSWECRLSGRRANGEATALAGGGEKVALIAYKAVMIVGQKG